MNPALKMLTMSMFFISSENAFHPVRYLLSLLMKPLLVCEVRQEQDAKDSPLSVCLL